MSEVVKENSVEIRDMSFGRGQRLIFDNVNIDVVKGKVTAIMGPSGSGKTTLLRLIGGQLAPLQGKILVGGHDIAKLNRGQFYYLRQQMGMLFQSGALFSDLTVFENVAFPLREHTNLNESFIQDLVLLKLEAVGLRGARNLQPSELSGGMQRRVALARALALDPALMMYDEPFAGQDPISIGVLTKLIRLLNDTLEMTSIIVSHDVPETCSIADYVYVIAQGKIMGEGTPRAIFKNASSWVHQFIHGLADGPVRFHYPAPDYSADLIGDSSD